MIAEKQMERMSPLPFVRWAGGKRWLAEKLAAEIEATQPRLYVEPFLGGGAVALAVSPSISKILADANPALIDCWRCIQRVPEALIGELRTIEAQFGDERDGYLAAREEFNFAVKHPRPMWVRRSALFLYLNARGFNGLWRTNAKGLYNVPFGKLESPKRADLTDIQEISAFVRGVDFRHENFLKLLHALYVKAVHTRRGNGRRVHALAGTAVYCDPPYDGTFEGYAEGGFDNEDQRMLAQSLASWSAHGAAVWTTNADTPLIRGLYEWAQIEPLEEHHQVGSTGERRGKRSCLLIRGGAAIR